MINKQMLYQKIIKEYQTFYVIILQEKYQN